MTKRQNIQWLGACAVITAAACSSQSGTPSDPTNSPGSGVDVGSDTGLGAGTDAATDQDADADAAPEEAGQDGGGSDAGTLTPSNVAPDICDTAGAQDLTVAAGEATSIDTTQPCDAMVPQANGLPSICVHKYANVSISGTLNVIGPYVFDVDSSNLPPSYPPLAIVATNAFSVEATGTIVGQNDLAPGADAGSVPASDGSGGAGHVTPGGDGTTSGTGGNSYGPTTGPGLISGSWGGGGIRNPLFSPGAVMPGRGGGAVQVIACHDLRLLGHISVDGTDGSMGQEASGTHATRGSNGGGGGSGGTLVIEAVRITGSGSLSAKGGNGADGAPYYNMSPYLFCAGGTGGTGGTGSSLPTAGTDGQSGSAGDGSDPGTVHGSGGSGGGGGSVGRIVIDLPNGSAPPSFTSDPPPSFGVVTVH